MSTPQTAPLKRVFYLDLVRALAAIIIVVTHFNNPYLANGGYLITNEPFGIYIGGLGVSLFLIISGAALTLTYKHPLDLKRFYYKRFIGIYPMFWIAWILATCYFFLYSHGYPLNAAPAKSFIFTFLGIDGMVANFHLPTMYLLGEWFLGFIVIFYIVFPLLLWGVERFPKTSAGLIAAIYAASFLVFDGTQSYPSNILLPTRLPELAFGMYFVRYIKRVPVYALPVAALVLGLSAFRPELDENLATTLVGIASFAILVWISDYVACKPLEKIIGLIAKYSYPIFLVHHVVIMKVFMTVDTSQFFPLQRYMLFFATCVVIGFLSWALLRINNATVKFFREAFSHAQ